jgi:hypothetical protein
MYSLMFWPLSFRDKWPDSQLAFLDFGHTTVHAMNAASVAAATNLELEY